MKKTIYNSIYQCQINTSKRKIKKALQNIMKKIKIKNNNYLLDKIKDINFNLKFLYSKYEDKYMLYDINIYDIIKNNIIDEYDIIIKKNIIYVKMINYLLEKIINMYKNNNKLRTIVIYTKIKILIEDNNVIILKEDIIDDLYKCIDNHILNIL